MTVQDLINKLKNEICVPGVRITEPVQLFVNVDANGDLCEVSGNKVSFKVDLSGCTSIDK